MTNDQIKNALALYKTPFYIYDKKKILDNCSLFKLFRSNVDVFFSLKSNFNPELVKLIIKSTGIGIETSSDFDFLIAQELKCEKIIHNSIYNDQSIYKKIITGGFPINFDNIDSFNRFNHIAGNKKFKCAIGFRVNFTLKEELSVYFNLMGEKSKLGIDENQIVSAYEKALLSGYKRFGLFAMIASNIIDDSFYNEFLDKLSCLKMDLEKKLKIKFEYIDIGGGFGIDYHGNKKFDIGNLNKKIEKIFPEQKIIIEPGRFIIGNAGYLVTKILSVKEKKNALVYIVDGGSNLFVRKAWFNQNHRTSFITSDLRENTTKKSFIYGPLFDNKDIIAESETLPRLNVGDYIIIHDAGAYGAVRMSNFGTLPFVRELLVDGNKIINIAKEQTFKNFLYKFKF